MPKYCCENHSECELLQEVIAERDGLLEEKDKLVEERDALITRLESLQKEYSEMELSLLEPEPEIAEKKCKLLGHDWSEEMPTQTCTRCGKTKAEV